jgi:hypothetical protein
MAALEELTDRRRPANDERPRPPFAGSQAPPHRAVALRQRRREMTNGDAISSTGTRDCGSRD